MLTNRELKQLNRLKKMKVLESHRPLVVKSLNDQIKRISRKHNDCNKY